MTLDEVMRRLLRASGGERHDGRFMPTSSEELRIVGARLDAVAATSQTRIADPLKPLVVACERFAGAWSGSWIGYHSRVYYEGFQTPPAGAAFSSEWGLMTGVMSGGSRGNWREYTQKDVVDAIEREAGISDLSEYERYSREARMQFDRARSTVLSILTTEVHHHPHDPLLTDAYETTKSLSLFTQADVVRINRPSGQLMSRDSLAMSQGLLAPPHLIYQGHLVELTQPGMQSANLGRTATDLADHLDRLLGTKESMDPVGARIFIGHGRSETWRVLKDFLQDRLHLQWEEFNRVSPAGIATSARLSEMLQGSSFAFLIMTAEDEAADGSMHARENVIHEAGLFQGKLGFARGIVMVEDGCEEFSNVHGLGQIRFSRGRIDGSFEEVREVLEREEVIPRSPDQGPP